jgi:hypothetical protein
MSEGCLDALWCGVRAANPEVMERDELASLVTDLARLRAWIDAAEVRAARRVRELASEGRSEPAAGLLGRSGRRSAKAAKAAAERERVCGQMPDLETALDAGMISAGHLDAVAAATGNLDEGVTAEFAGHVEDLVGQASRVGVDSFGRACRELARTLTARHDADAEVAELDQQRERSSLRRWVDRSTGMHHTHLELDAIRAAGLWSAIDRELRRLRQQDNTAGVRFDRLQVDAAVAAFAGTDVNTLTDTSAVSGPVVDRVPEITVLIDHHRLLHDATAAGVCETEDGVALPAVTVRRLCCDAEVLPMVLDGDGVVVDQGRARRTVTREQRRRLRAMHRSCAHPDCQVGYSTCRIHHVRFWTRHRGRTDIDNLVPLCEQHHHQVHEGGWKLSMTPDRVATWTRPDGTTYHHGPTTDRTTSPAA